MAPGERAVVALVALIAALLAPVAGARQFPDPVWIDRDGTALPFQEHQEVLEFLRTAEIVDAQVTDEGTTQPYRVLLRRGDLAVRGIFRWVDRQETLARYASSRGELFFRDRALFECAAYQLSRHLGMDSVPPAVERTYERQRGSLQIWVENAITEGQRVREGRFDADRDRWRRQLDAMKLFDVLIGNIDRNLGNMLIDADWRLWLIDHTRAFRGAMRAEELPFDRVDRGFLDGLRRLDRNALEGIVGDYLTARELGGLDERRRQLLEHFERLITERGEQRVVYSY